MSQLAFPEPDYRTSAPFELVTRRSSERSSDMTSRGRRHWRKGVVITLATALVATAGVATWKMSDEPAARVEMVRWATFGRIAAP